MNEEKRGYSSLLMEVVYQQLVKELYELRRLVAKIRYEVEMLRTALRMHMSNGDESEFDEDHIS